MKFKKLKELEKICSVPVWLYSIPSTQIFELLPDLDIDVMDPNYDRWEPTIKILSDDYGLDFYINNDNIFSHPNLKTIAETFYILHVDKCINGIVNIRQHKNGYYKVQPGVKRMIIMKLLKLHNVQFVCFDKKIPNADKFLIKVLNKRFSYAEKEIGPEIHDPEWNSVLKQRLTDKPIHVKINNYQVVLDDIVFLKKTAYKSIWKLVYK